MQSTEFFQAVMLILVWVLTPLVPSTLLFKYIPSTTISTSGRLAGLTVNATGAFGGYIALFLVLGYFVATPLQGAMTIHPEECWWVTAKLQFLDEGGNPIKSGLDLDPLRLETDPKVLKRTWRNGLVEVRFSVPRPENGLVSGRFEYPDYRAEETISVNPGDWSSPNPGERLVRKDDDNDVIKVVRWGGFGHPYSGAAQPAPVAASPFPAVVGNAMRNPPAGGAAAPAVAPQPAAAP